MRSTVGILSSLMVLASLGCDTSSVRGSGVLKTETRQVAPFDEIELIGAGRIEIVIGEHKPLEVSADDNLLRLITTEVHGRRLVIRNKRSLRPKRGIVVKTTAPDITAILCSGADSISIDGVQNDALRLNLSGAADVTLTGETGRLTIALSGAGSIRAEQLQAQEATVELNGAGSATVNATETLDVTISGVGSVRYIGDPKITQRISGLGSLSKKD